MPEIKYTRNKKLKQNLTEKNGRKIESVATQELQFYIEFKEKKESKIFS